MGKSAKKKFHNYQERIAKSNFKPKENPLKLGWTFNTWYEKVIFFCLMILGIWKLIEIIF